MARPRQVDMELVAQAQMLALEAETLEDLRCAQAVLLPALLDATLEQTAALMGVGRATVPRYQARLRKRLEQPAQPQPKWGGRRRASMSEERSAAFWPRGRSYPKRAGCWWCRRCVRRCRSDSDARWRPRSCTACWHATVGASWRPTLGIPRATPQCKRSGKKTARNIGDLAETRRCSRSQGAPNVPGRSAFRAHGTHSPLLGANPQRPVVCNGYEREFLYVYGAVNPCKANWTG